MELKNNLIIENENYCMDLTALLIEGTFPMMLQQLVIFALSVIFLAKSSQIVVKHSVEVAKIMHIGELVIGVVILSVATSLPELAVSLLSINSGNVGVAVGNIFGSNIANLGLVLAIPAIIAPLKVKKGTFERLPTLLFFSSIIPLAFLAMENISAVIGFALIASFIFYAAYSTSRNIGFRMPKRKKKKKKSKGIIRMTKLPIEFYKSLILLIIGAGVLGISAQYTVTSASKVSMMLGVAESVIGATIIAIGTSLPELSVSLTAIKTKHHKLAIGNAIGSCLTNITLILGIVLLLSPVAINPKIFSTLLFFVIGITMVAWYFFTSERTLDRTEGMILLFAYMLFLITTFGVQITII